MFNTSVLVRFWACKSLNNFTKKYFFSNLYKSLGRKGCYLFRVRKSSFNRFKILVTVNYEILSRVLFNHIFIRQKSFGHNLNKFLIDFNFLAFTVLKMDESSSALNLIKFGLALGLVARSPFLLVPNVFEGLATDHEKKHCGKLKYKKRLEFCRVTTWFHTKFYL